MWQNRHCCENVHFQNDFCDAHIYTVGQDYLKHTFILYQFILFIFEETTACIYHHSNQKQPIDDAMCVSKDPMLRRHTEHTTEVNILNNKQIRQTLSAASGVVSYILSRAEGCTFMLGCLDKQDKNHRWPSCLMSLISELSHSVHIIHCRESEWSCQSNQIKTDFDFFSSNLCISAYNVCMFYNTN